MIYARLDDQLTHILVFHPDKVGGRPKTMNSQKRTKRPATVAMVPSSYAVGARLTEFSRRSMKIWL